MVSLSGIQVRWFQSTREVGEKTKWGDPKMVLKVHNYSQSTWTFLALERITRLNSSKLKPENGFVYFLKLFSYLLQAALKIHPVLHPELLGM